MRYCEISFVGYRYFPDFYKILTLAESTITAVKIYKAVL